MAVNQTLLEQHLHHYVETVTECAVTQKEKGKNQQSLVISFFLRRPTSLGSWVFPAVTAHTGFLFILMITRHLVLIPNLVL